MAHVFKPGDRVVIVKSRQPDRIGQVATVTSDAYSAFCSRGRIHRASKCWCHAGLPMVQNLDLPAEKEAVVSYPPSYLEPYLPDGHEKVEWTDELRRLCKVKTKENA